MKRITHTKDSLKLVEFLQRYPDTWNGYASDKRTIRALLRAQELHSSIKVSVATQQMKWVSPNA